MKKLKNKLRELRAKETLSQQGLADAVGVSRQTINAIENGIFEPSCRLALLITRYFKLKVDETFWLE